MVIFLVQLSLNNLSDVIPWYGGTTLESSQSFTPLILTHKYLKIPDSTYQNSTQNVSPFDQSWPIVLYFVDS